MHYLLGNTLNVHKLSYRADFMEQRLALYTGDLGGKENTSGPDFRGESTK